MSKLDDLCAIKIMGWELSKSPLEAWVNPAGKGEGRYMHEWYPSRSLDDALVCLERAAKGQGWLLSYLKYKGRYKCKIFGEDARVIKFGKTPMLAICHCALAICGVPESEIQEAMK